MKRLLIILLFCSPLITYSQKLRIDPETNSYSASGIIALDTMSADKGYGKAMEWIAINYKSAKDVIQYQDTESKKIIVKGNFPVFMFLKEGWIKHTLTVEFKNNKYRYSYNNLSYYSPGSGEIGFEQNMVSKRKLIEKTDEKIAESIKSLTTFLNNVSKTDNW